MSRAERRKMGKKTHFFAKARRRDLRDRVVQKLLRRARECARRSHIPQPSERPDCLLQSVGLEAESVSAPR